MIIATDQTSKKRRRRRKDQKLESEPNLNLPLTQEQTVNQVQSKLQEEIVKAMEAEFGDRCRENLIIIYDLRTDDFRTIQLKMNFKNVNLGIRKMRLSLTRKKMNPDEVIVNEEIILNMEFKAIH